MRGGLILWMIVLGCIMGGQVFAAPGPEPDDRPLTPDYSKLYYLGYNVATSSSPCIGNPVTAECAVNTYEACISWWDVKLCKMMNYKLPAEYKKYGPDKKAMQIYKFISKRLLTAEDIPEHYRYIWHSGDTVIFMSAQICMRYDHCYSALKDRDDPQGKCLPLDCDDPGSIIDGTGKHPTDIYVLRQGSDQKWSVVTLLRSYYIPTDPDRPDKLYQEGLSQAPW